ncbi:hypothetical protein HDE_12220 [Halotydeus destructor]|nr:hypothetical protein HDE_12220 [Halotydeus destructor]
MSRLTTTLVYLASYLVLTFSYETEYDILLNGLKTVSKHGDPALTGNLNILVEARHKQWNYTFDAASLESHRTAGARLTASLPKVMIYGISVQVLYSGSDCQDAVIKGIDFLPLRDRSYRLDGSVMASCIKLDSLVCHNLQQVKAGLCSIRV